MHRLWLANHPFGKTLLKFQQLLTLTSKKALDWNPSPTGHHIRDISRFHLFSQQGRPFLLGLIQRLFKISAALLNAMQLVVLKTGGLFQISVPLCFGNRMAKVFIFLKQLTQLLQLLPFRLPSLPELTQPVRSLKTIALELNPFSVRCLLRGENRQLHSA